MIIINHRSDLYFNTKNAGQVAFPSNQQADYRIPCRTYQINSWQYPLEAEIYLNSTSTLFILIHVCALLEGCSLDVLL